MVHFRKIPERSTGQEVIMLKVNPKMDIVALALANGDIILHRLLTWQRVWSVHLPKNFKSVGEGNKVIDFEWSPDGKNLAVLYSGYLEEDKNSYPTYLVDNFRPPLPKPVTPTPSTVATPRGRSRSTASTSAPPPPPPFHTSIVLYDIEATKQISFTNCDTQVRSLYWQHRDCTEDFCLPLDTLDIPFLDLFGDEDEFQAYVASTGGARVNGFAGCDLKNGGSSGSSSKKGGRIPRSYHHRTGYSSRALEDYERIKLFGHQPGLVKFNVLITGSLEGYIDVFAFGYYRLLRIDINALRPNMDTWTLKQPQNIRKIWISSDLALLHAITEVKQAEVSQLFTLSSRLLSSKWRELYAFVRIKAQLDIRLEFLFDTLKEITSIWEDLIAEVDSKLSNYVQREEEDESNDDPFKPRSNKIKLEPNEFIEMLVFGEISMNLERFLMDLTEKGLKKLATTIETSFVDIHKANIEKMQRALFHVLSLLNVLKGMALHDIQFGDLFLSVPVVNAFYRETLSMLIKTVQLQQNLNDSMKKTKAFIRWLHKCVHMVTNSDSTGANTSISGGADAADSLLGSPNYVLTTQDLNLIMNFLRENSLTNGFKFENIAFFLRKIRSKVKFVEPLGLMSTPGTGRKSSQRLRSRSAARGGGMSLAGRSQSRSPITPASGSSSTRKVSPRSAKSASSSKSSVKGQPPENNNQKDQEQPKISVPYKEFLKEQRLKQFLETLSHLQDPSEGDEVLGEFFPDMTRPKSLTPDLNLEDVCAFARDLFDDSTDIDLLHESAYSEYSLYEHLYRLYEQYQTLFDPTMMNRAVVDQIKEDKEVKFVIAEEGKNTNYDFRKEEYIRFGDYISYNPAEDYVVLFGGPVRRFPVPPYFTLMRTNRRQLFSPISTEPGVVPPIELEFCHFSFTAKRLDGKRKGTRHLTIEDVKFYNEEFCTFVLSDPQGPKKKKVILDANVAEQQLSSLKLPKVKGDEQEMSLGDDDADMISEDDDPVLLPSSSSSAKGQDQVQHQMPETVSQYLVQLRYAKVLPSDTANNRLHQFNGIDTTQWYRERLNDVSTKDGRDYILLDLSRKLVQARPKGMELEPDGSLEELLMDVDDQDDQVDDENTVELDLDSNDYAVVRYLGEGSPNSQLATSGLRKVACLSTNSRTKCAVFEMDVSEDEDEEEEDEDDDHSRNGGSDADDDDDDSDGNGIHIAHDVPEAGTEEVIGGPDEEDDDTEMAFDLRPMTASTAGTPSNNSPVDDDEGPQSFGYRSGRNQNVIEMAAPLVPGVDSFMNPIPGPATTQAHARQARSFIRIEQQMLKRDDIHIKSEPED